ncbi:MAG: hypothetical protein FJW39_34505, partial [Acidobacteria bacterium]|nr:hypothetical protein [Acidobacteriota bacterium]
MTALSLVGFSLGAHPAVAPRPFPADSEWPCDRRNPGLDARSPLRGRMTNPHVVWRQFIGTLESQIVVEPVQRNSKLILPDDEPIVGTTNPLPLIHSFLPAPKPAEEAASPTVVYADVLPDVPGKEKIEFESAFGKPTVNGRWQKCVGRCFARRDGQWTQVWETEPIEYLFQPLPMAGDFDGDGSLEIAILPFYELLLLDARTGRIKDRRRFTDTRSYGFFGVYDFDGDGKSEFLIQADFSKHIDALGFRNGKLEVLWQRNIEPDISNPEKILRVGPTPVADVDGDGRSEVLACVYNDGGDHRWHLTVHDALTGRVKADFADECLIAPLDLDGDGVSELLTVSATSAGPSDLGDIRVRSLKGGESKILWRQTASAWQTWDPPQPANVNSTATFGARTVLFRMREGRPVLVLRQGVDGRGRAGGAATSIRLTVVRWTRDTFEPLMSITGKNLDALGMDDAGRLLVRCRHHPGQRAELAVQNGNGQVRKTTRLGGGAGPVVLAWPDHSAQPTLLVQGAGDELVAFPPPKGGSSPDSQDPISTGTIRRISGRGQSTMWPETRGPVVADLLGNGRRQIVLATSSPSGCGRLTARDLDGRDLWHHDFESIPGTLPVWNTGGIVLWQAAHFTDRQRQDVLVTIRRSMQHSEESLLLSGRDGRELWHRARQISQRGVGGAPFALADFDGDGLDDAASLNPSILYVLKGTTGRDWIAKDASWPEVPARPVYWGLPFAGDFLG